MKRIWNRNWQRANSDHLVSVVDVVVGEVGRTPAGDWIADVLGSADDRRENDQEQNGVAMVKTVNEVVVVSKMDFGDTGSSTDDSVHGSALMVITLPATDGRQYSALDGPAWRGYRRLYAKQRTNPFYLVRSMPLDYIGYYAEKLPLITAVSTAFEKAVKCVIGSLAVRLRDGLNSATIYRAKRSPYLMNVVSKPSSNSEDRDCCYVRLDCDDTSWNSLRWKSEQVRARQSNGNPVQQRTTPVASPFVLLLARI